MIYSATQDTICAISTPPGTGGIAIIRVSGPDTFAICDRLFTSGKTVKTEDGGGDSYVVAQISETKKSERQRKKLADYHANKVIYGFIQCDGTLLDEVLITVFRAPHSFTGENTVEISCHGSIYIQQQILRLLIENGARTAQPGEFTQRAFLNGKMDLSQAEAVTDLIASTSAGMHKLAINQMRGGFSNELTQLRTQLLDLTSLIELELDFAEEEVEFADRTQLLALAENMQKRISCLTESFDVGNVVKNGIPVAIIGKPNTGKSTLLNTLLNEERAIVSEIPGTTRDTIEETLSIGSQLFRFIDTAGIRTHTNDNIEALGIQRTFEKAEKAAIILYLFDLTVEEDDLDTTIRWLQNFQKPFLIIGTKNDIAYRTPTQISDNILPVHISCKDPADIERIKSIILDFIQIPSFDSNDVIVTNIRHYESLCKALSAITCVIESLKNNLSGDLLSQDIRECTHHLGEITGEITTDEVLGNIFEKFCIGK